jgi:hypothetical protein
MFSRLEAKLDENTQAMRENTQVVRSLQAKENANRGQTDEVSVVLDIMAYWCQQHWRVLRHGCACRASPDRPDHPHPYV